ncbi:hypothetical protein HAZT_HAZT003743 [Hyalella azteca]|uniref:Immunoglobulin V-set domain-containing protein n=1 Tax=Hyalella azteca TaxID=294128 RepID=A0A6A0GZZ4_HYAAZ|nr:hypothetical protein HAZT_HAZT003743 [Hyalella azteca]
MNGIAPTLHTVIVDVQARAFTPRAFFAIALRCAWENSDILASINFRSVGKPDQAYHVLRVAMYIQYQLNKVESFTRFNRSIPTNERYEMVGEASAGEHHLRIYNATLVDDADFQCQVGPADGHAAIRATGHLTVLSEYC